MMCTAESVEPVMRDMGLMRISNAHVAASSVEMLVILRPQPAEASVFHNGSTTGDWSSPMSNMGDETGCSKYC